MKNSQESTVFAVLHIIKNEEEIVGSNSLGIVREERICKLQETFTFYLIFLITLHFYIIRSRYFSNQEKNSQRPKERFLALPLS